MSSKTQFKTFPGKVKSWDDQTLTIEHFISTETQDSGGDIMLADGMKMRGKPVVLFQHGQDPKFGNEPIAKVLDIRVGIDGGKKGLIAKTQFYDGTHLTPPDSTGRRLYEKARDDVMPNWSIGFNSTKEKPCQGGRVVEEWELHEYSQVAVGMNAGANTLHNAGALCLKIMIKEDEEAPEGFKDLAEFIAKTEEMTYEAGQEMSCIGGKCLDDAATHSARAHDLSHGRKSEKGGQGSGNFGHSGRPGAIGGSGGGGDSGTQVAQEELQEAMGKMGISEEHAAELAPELHQIAEDHIENMWADGRRGVDKEAVKDEVADTLHNHGEAVWAAAGYSHSPDESTGADQDKYVAALDKLTGKISSVVGQQIRTGLEDIREEARQSRGKSFNLKPYPSEHACRLAEPSTMDRFRRQNGAQEHDGKKYDVIYGHVKSSGKWVQQAYRYPKDTWSADAAAAHCKSHDGSFEAASTEKVLAIKSKKPSHKLAHKAVHSFHKEFMEDLKSFKEDDLEDMGVNGCAKEAMEDFSDNVAPHVEKYIKCVREMSKDDELEDDETMPPLEGTEEPERKGGPGSGRYPAGSGKYPNDNDTANTASLEEKSYHKAHRALHEARNEMIKAIHACKADKSCVPSQKADELIAAHHEAAFPHAKEFIKTWHSSHKPETKPAPDPADAEKVKVIKLKPQAQPKTLKVSTKAAQKTVITPELVKELIASGVVSMQEAIREDLRKLAGKVTK